MASYKLGIVGRGNVKEIDGISFTSLERMDELTRSFQNEDELKKYLVEKWDLQSEDYKKSIKVIYNYRGIRKIPVVYGEMSKYFDFNYLLSKILSYSQDTEFLRKIAMFYKNVKFQEEKANHIFYYLSTVKQNGGNHYYSSLVRHSLNDIFETACLEEYPNTNVKNKVYRYKARRDLVVLVYEYDKKQNINNGPDYSDPDGAAGKRIVIEEKPKEKVKTGKWQQLSFIDGTFEP